MLNKIFDKQFTICNVFAGTRANLIKLFLLPWIRTIHIHVCLLPLHVCLFPLLLLFCLFFCLFLWLSYYYDFVSSIFVSLYLHLFMLLSLTFWYIYIYIYAIMKTMWPSGYHYSGFVATHALGQLMHNDFMATHPPISIETRLSNLSSNSESFHEASKHLNQSRCDYKLQYKPPNNEN